MFKAFVIATGCVAMAAVAVPARAQGIEVSAWGGYSLSDGVNLSSTIIAGDGNAYSRIDPEDGGVFGFNVGYLLGSGAGFGFIYSHQWSNLLLGGGVNERDLGSLGISTYHGYFSYDFLQGSAFRPFALIGFGATNYSSVDATIAGTPQSLPSQTKFSTTWSAGVKFLPSPRVGVRAAIQWTPTYIKSDPGGWWCDPFWGCYLTGDPQYSNQLMFTGGVTFRFGGD
jgi:opacity protein-like surface antigen